MTKHSILILNFLKQYSIALAILLCFIYGYLGYFFVRSEFMVLITLCALAFIAAYAIIEKSDFSFRQLFFLAILYRLVLIFATPNLSQDFYRFYWDGQMILNGLNPYLENVNYYFFNNLQDQIYNAEILKQGMGKLNASNYSNYPPVSQLLYAVAAWIAQDSILYFIVALRVLLIGFDVIFIYIARKVMMRFNLNPKHLFWYSLNPLCILEITGNLHLEGVMITLFILSFYILLKNKLFQSGGILALSIGAKLLSLVALPLFFKKIMLNPVNKKSIANSLYFGLGIICLLFLQFTFFYDPRFVNNFFESIALWFGKFEFNASIFYLVRWIGYQIYGYNIIGTYGLVMPVLCVLIFTLILFWKKTSDQQILIKFLWMLTIYFMLSTTVHPWYILFPLALSVFTRYKFGILWSFLVFLSYYAYKDEQFSESIWILIIEYNLLIICIVYDVFGKKIKSYLDEFFVKQ